MAFIGIPEKEVKKVNKELIELHKSVTNNYLLQRGLEINSRRRFFKLYDIYIKEKNIQRYFFCPINIFVKMLVRDELDKIAFYKSHTIIVKHKVRKKR